MWLIAVVPCPARCLAERWVTGRMCPVVGTGEGGGGGDLAMSGGWVPGWGGGDGCVGGRSAEGSG